MLWEAPHALLTCRTWVMPYFLRTCRSLSAEMEPMKSPGRKNVGGSAFVFLLNESDVRGSGSGSSASPQAKSRGRVDAPVSSSRLPKSIPVTQRPHLTTSDDSWCNRTH
jgi:hypothetical protein